MSQRNFRIVFLLYSFIYLGIEHFNGSEIRYFAKPLILIFLSIYFFKNTPATSSRFSNFVQLALFLSLIGDVLLLFAPNAEIYFIFGLIFFLMAHLAYIFAFKLSLKNSGKEISLRHVLYAGIPFLLFAGSFFIFIKDKLGALMFPVLAYIAVITCMGIFSTLRYQRVKVQSFYFIFLGAIGFILSDSLLAINKFHTSFSGASFFIMASYIAAQWLIVEGSIDELKN